MSDSGLEIVPILLCFGVAGGIVGRIKGSSFFIWFLVSFCIPFLGLATAVLYRYDSRELRRQCPECGRIVKLYDAVCVTCGHELEFPDTAIASEETVRQSRVAVRSPAS